MLIGLLGLAGLAGAMVIGDRAYRGLGRTSDYGSPVSARLFIGRNRGKEEENRSGHCRTAPRSYSASAVDRSLLALRARQLGSKADATRYTTRGWFHGAPEASLVYEIFYTGDNARESSPEIFKANMTCLAEHVAHKICQDLVIVTHSDGGVLHTYRSDAKPPLCRL